MNLLSIITASYNSEVTIKDTILSVLNQTGEINYEFIIIDGGSIDKTVEIVKSYESEFANKQIDYKWISEPDTGIYDAWNKGVKIAKGNWISFLGSDDTYNKTALNDYYLAINQLSKENKTHLIYSNVDYVDGSKLIRKIDGIWSWKQFKHFMCIAHVGSFHSRAYFKEYGVFNTSYKICGDYELLLRAKERLKTLKIEKTTVCMQVGGVSNKMIDKAFKETYKAKIDSGGVPKIIALLDLTLAHFKYMVKHILKNN